MTRTVMLKIPGDWVSVGVQENTPLLASIVEPTGAPASRLKLIDWPEFGSIASALNVRAVPGFADWSPMGARTGGRFASMTVRDFETYEERAGELSSLAWANSSSAPDTQAGPVAVITMLQSPPFFAPTPRSVSPLPSRPSKLVSA